MTENIIKEQKLIATYCRVSTAKQEEDETIKTQKIEIKKFADKNGYIIVSEYEDEGWSGDVLVRPNLDRLRLDAKQKNWEAVLIYDPDRLARRSAWQEVVMEELKELGIDVLFVTVPKPKTDEDIIMYKMRGVFSEYERMKIKERFRLGKVRKVMEGHILTTVPKYGYNYIQNVKIANQPKVHGYYEINEEEAKVVSMIFKWVADEGLTLRAVVRKLQELKIKPKKSKRGVWSTSTLSTMLRHKIYIGEAHWGSSYAVIPENPTSQEKYRQTKKTSRKRRPEKDWYIINTVPPIISKDLFDKAQAQLKSNFALCDRNKKNEYLLAGRIWCDCGCKRAGEGAQHGKYLYYRCIGRVRTFPLPATCDEKGINARIADRLTWNKLEELMSSPELIRKQVSLWTDIKQTEAYSSKEDTSMMGKDIDKLKKQEERYAKAYGAGVLTIEQLKEYSLPIKEKVKSLEIQMARSKQDQDQMSISEKPTEEEIENYSRIACRELKGLNFGLRKEIVMDTIDKVVSGQNKLQVYGHIPITNVGSFTISRHCRITKRG